MRNLYTQITLAAVLASSMAKNITLERRASVEIGGVTHEVAASVAIPIGDGDDPEVVHVEGGVVTTDPPEVAQEPSPTLADHNHAKLFGPDYERGVCQNIIYDYREESTEIGREVRKTARGCYDGCVSQGGRPIPIRSVFTAETPMGGYVSEFPVFDEYACFFEDPDFDAAGY